MCGYLHRAWFNRLLPLSRRPRALFVDDSADHVTTTREACDVGRVHAFHFQTEQPDHLLQEIRRFFTVAGEAVVSAAAAHPV